MTVIDRRYGVAEGIAIKAPVRVATTANITLAGLQTIDGVTLAALDRVLVKNQTTGANNGIYLAATGIWTRALDFDGDYDVVAGTRVVVTAGTTYALNEFIVSTAGTIVIGTTAITFYGPIAIGQPTATDAASYATRALVASSLVGATPTYLRTAGYATAGDGGGALYKRVALQPTHAGKVQSADGAWWEYVLEEFVNVRQFGAKGDNVADDSTFIQNAINFLQNRTPVPGGTLRIPTGYYRITTGLTHIGGGDTAAISIIGAGQNATYLGAYGSDVAVLRMNVTHSRLDGLTIYGKGVSGPPGETFGATQHGLVIDGTVHVSNVRVWGGNSPLFDSGSVDGTRLNIDASLGYGNANCLTTGANWYMRCKFDHASTGIAPTNSAPYSARANTTAYAVGNIVTLSGYYIQCSVGGVTAGSAPALKNYNVTITDGTVTWILVSPSSSFAGAKINTGAGENHFVQCDFSGTGYSDAVHVDAAGAIARITDCVLSCQTNLAAATTVSIRGCTFNGSIISSSSVGAMWLEGNHSPTSSSITVGAGQSHFTIADCSLGGGAITVAAGASDDYSIVDNKNCTVVDGGTGVNKIVRRLVPNPEARVYNSATIACANATVVPLTFNTERYDSDTIHSTSANTGRLTATTAGVYVISGSIAYAAAAGGMRITGIRLNGTTNIAIDGRVTLGAGAETSGVVTTQYQLAVGDYVELTAFQDSGGSINVLAGNNYTPEFMMTRVGP